MKKNERPKAFPSQCQSIFSTYSSFCSRKKKKQRVSKHFFCHTSDIRVLNSSLPKECRSKGKSKYFLDTCMNFLTHFRTCIFFF